MTRVIEPEAKPDADYTTQQTADLCGISINTLLAWERRYGVPSPRRDERNERLYDANDLRIIRWLQAQTAQGTPIGKAIRLLPELDQDEPHLESSSEDVVVAFDVTRMSGTDHLPAAPDNPATSQRAKWQYDLTVALHRYDRAAVATILSTAVLETSPLLVSEHVILPTLQAFVRRYEDGDLDRAVLRIAERWLSARLAHWLDNANPDREHAHAPSLLVADNTPWNAVHALTVALRLALEGHHIIDLPPDCPVEEIRSVATSTNASQVILMTSDETDQRALDSRIDLLRIVLPRSVSIARMTATPDPNIQDKVAKPAVDAESPMHADGIGNTSIHDSRDTAS